jgi:hypothetical protein
MRIAPSGPVAGDDRHAHLEIMTGVGELQPHADSLDEAVLGALDATPLSRTSLRAALRVRNERLGLVLERLAAQGRILRDGDRWARVGMAVPVPAFTHEAERNGESEA